MKERLLWNESGRMLSRGRQMDSVPLETLEGSLVIRWPSETVALANDEKDDRLLPHPVHKRLKAKKTFLLQRATFHANSEFEKTRNVSFGIVPRVRIARLKKGCIHCNKCQHSTYWRRRKTHQQIKEKWCRKISCDSEGNCRIVLWISNSFRRKCILHEPGKIGEHVIKFPKARWHRNKTREGKGSIVMN